MNARGEGSGPWVLLNPGPVNLSGRVRDALAGTDLCHREPEFASLQARIRRRLLDVYGLDDGWAAVLLTGSGTAAVEAMLSSLAPAQGRVLVLENGVYGERMSRIADIHGIPSARLRHGWGEPIDVDAVGRALDRHGDVHHVAVVHHETTTGRLNDLASLGAVCRRRGVGLLVDGVSSFGGEHLDFEDMAIEACAGTANKCLHGVPGACFAVVRRRALAAAGRQPRTLYLDLAAYCGEQDRDGTPFTPSVQAFYALDAALAELAEAGGWQARRARYRRLAGRVAEGLRALGVRPLLEAGASSAVLSAWHIPQGVDYAGLHDALKRRGFVIYAGQGELASRIFRVSTMGAIGDADIERLLEAFAEALEEGGASGDSR